MRLGLGNIGCWLLGKGVNFWSVKRLLEHKVRPGTLQGMRARAVWGHVLADLYDPVKE